MASVVAKSTPDPFGAGTHSSPKSPDARRFPFQSQPRPAHIARRRAAAIFNRRRERSAANGTTIPEANDSRHSPIGRDRGRNCKFGRGLRRLEGQRCDTRNERVLERSFGPGAAGWASKAPGGAPGCRFSVLATPACVARCRTQPKAMRAAEMPCSQRRSVGRRCSKFRPLARSTPHKTPAAGTGQRNDTPPHWRPRRSICGQTRHDSPLCQ